MDTGCHPEEVKRQNEVPPEQAPPLVEEKQHEKEAGDKMENELTPGQQMSFDSDSSSEILPPPASDFDDDDVLPPPPPEEDKPQDQPSSSAAPPPTVATNPPEDEIDLLMNPSPAEQDEKEPQLVVTPSAHTHPKEEEAAPVEILSSVSPASSSPSSPVHSPGGKLASSPTSANTNYKTTIDARLTQEIAKCESFSSQRRSPELVPLTKKYQDFRKQLRTLIAAIKAYKQTTEKMQSARTQLFQEYANMSKDNPLLDHVGKPLNEEQLHGIHKTQGTVVVKETHHKSEEMELPAEKAQEIAQHMGTLSLAAVQQLARVHEQISAQEYDKYILDYATEWETIITKRLDEELKQVSLLQQRRLHYERKVSGLRKRLNTMEEKGKEIHHGFSEKVTRNDQKLNVAWELHEERASKLCVLLEEVTLNGWKDLYPLVKNSMRFELNKLSRDEASYGRLSFTLEAMKKLSLDSTTSTQHHLTPTSTTAGDDELAPHHSKAPEF